MSATRHLLVLTIDTDPDGLAGRTTNRENLRWNHLQKGGRRLIEAHETLGTRLGCRIPIHWFIRADRQIWTAFGTCCHLLRVFDTLWDEARSLGHRLGWHPHLYRTLADGSHSVQIGDAEAVEQIQDTWKELQSEGFQPDGVRVGEGWHTPATFQAMEQCGLTVDSTAIPGRHGGEDHPMDWRLCPNQPFFPQADDLQRPGPPRPMLEVPMTTWDIQAPYDTVPRIRYMNAAVHPTLFQAAVTRWQDRQKTVQGLHVWVFIMHPEEGLPGPTDHLYARDPIALMENLLALVRSIESLGHEWTFTDLVQANTEWRTSKSQTGSRD